MHRIRKLSSSITDLLSIRKRLNDKNPEDDDTNYSKNPLHLAVAIGDLERTRYLLDSGLCDVDEEDGRGRIPLHISVLTKFTQITRLLVHDYNSCVDHADYSRCTAAHLIAKHNKLDHCRLLLEVGADFAVEDKYGRSAVDIAAELGHEELLDLLIEHGCVKQVLDQLNTRVHLKSSALHLAARNGHVRCVYKLLRAGFDLNLGTENGSALHESIKNGHVQVVRLLLHLGVDATVRNRDQQCARELATGECESRSISGHLIQTLMQQYPLRIYATALEDQQNSLNSTHLQFKKFQQIWIIDRSNPRYWKGILFDERGQSQTGFFEPHKVCVDRIESGEVHSTMPTLRSIKDTHNGRATVRRMKRVDVPQVPDVPGMQEELNRRRSRHLSAGGLPQQTQEQADYVEMQPMGNYGAMQRSASRASSSCAGTDDLYTSLDRKHSSVSSFASYPSMSSQSQLPQYKSVSTFQQQQPHAPLLMNTALMQQQNHRNSTGSSSSQASSGFESSKTLNNLANSNSSGSFASTLFTADSSPPPPLISHSAADTLRKSNRHSMSAASDGSASRPRSQCSQIAPMPPINVAEMISRGIPDAEILGEWLDKMGMQRYLTLFITQGYDIPSIAKLTSEDLLALGVTDPTDRKRLHANIQEWCVNDPWPTNVEKGESAAFWLVSIGLQQYVRLFEQEGYIQIKDLEQLSFEDLEDMGIKKLGHIKRICLALRKLKQHRLQSQQPSTSSNLMSIPSLTACSSPSALQLGANNSQQQFHSPDSGFTESGSLFSAIQKPAQISNYSIYQPPQSLSSPVPTLMDDLLDKPPNRLQIFSTRQMFSDQKTHLNQQRSSPSNRLNSPPPPAPMPLSSRGYGENGLGARNYTTSDFTTNKWLDYQKQNATEWTTNGANRSSQPPTPIRQPSTGLSSFGAGQISQKLNETSFTFNGLSAEIGTIQLAK